MITVGQQGELFDTTEESLDDYIHLIDSSLDTPTYLAEYISGRRISLTTLAMLLPRTDMDIVDLTPRFSTPSLIYRMSDGNEVSLIFEETAEPSKRHGGVPKTKISYRLELQGSYYPMELPEE